VKAADSGEGWGNWDLPFLAIAVIIQVIIQMEEVMKAYSMV
jgi:hypothetical protein